MASRDSIHVYVPRNLKQALPTRPDLIVKLPVSEKAHHSGGYIDENHPHSMNHMIVGSFGDLEILLVACDDGDMLAFYTHMFQAEIENPQHGTRVRNFDEIEPFLHENVGCTAWGLAIHQQSRLIAVSSNLKEVTIFAMATNGRYDTDDLLDDIDDYESFPELKEFDDNSRPHSFRDRTHNFSLRLRLGNFANNIPAIAFVSREDGEASDIVACDINGWVVCVYCLASYQHATFWGFLAISMIFSINLTFE